MSHTVRRSSFRLTLAALAVVALMGGCAITPQPITATEALEDGQRDKLALAAETEQAMAPMAMAEAIARALKFNRDRRVQMMETALSVNQLQLSRFDMLPQAAASAGYNARDSIAASSSGVLVGDTIVQSSPPTYSASADKQGSNLNLGLTWNVLDFGLSYVRGHQQADRVLMAQERERKAINNLIQDVRTAYWRALSAQRLLARVVPLHQRVLLALNDSRQIEAQRLKSPLDALTYQRDLLDNRRSIEALQKDLTGARIALATLIGLPPGTVFTLVDGGESELKVPQLKVDVETLERTALAKRPELLETRYQTRITHADGRAALLALLPGLQLNAGLHHDGNDYLLNNRWNDYGATLSLNLFNLLKAPAVRRVNDQQKHVADERRLALTAAVLGQVHVSKVDFDEARRQFGTANDYLTVVRRIREQMDLLRSANRGGDLQLIREELGEMLAELRRDVAYADLQNSYGRIFAAAGLDALPERSTDGSIAGLAQALDARFERWGQGEIGFVMRPLQSQVTAWTGSGAHRFTPAADTFSLGGEVTYQARLANGDPLPVWMQFDGKSLGFVGNPPAGMTEVAVDVVATNLNGSKASDRFVLSLHNTNDLPAADALVTHATVKGAKPLRGNFAAMDADRDALAVRLAPGQELPPGLTVDDNGEWQFDPGHPAYRHLAAGATQALEVAFVLRDPHGGEGRARLHFDVAGRNSAPTLAAVPALTVAATDAAVERQLSADDPDDGANLRWEALAPTLPEGFSLQADGRWRFDPQHEAYRHLAPGELRTLLIPLRVRDEHGAASIARLHIIVKGVAAATPAAASATTPVAVPVAVPGAAPGAAPDAAPDAAPATTPAAASGATPAVVSVSTTPADEKVAQQ